MKRIRLLRVSFNSLIKRYVEKYDRHNEIYRFIMDELQENLFQSSNNNYRYYELAALAARWAEMELKDMDKEEKHVA